MNKKILIVVLLVVILLLVGGAAGAFFLLGGKNEEVAQVEAPPPPPPPELRPTFLPLDPIAIFVQNEGRPRREVTVMVTIKVMGTQNIPEINEKIPALRDIYIRSLYPLTFKVPKFWQAKDLGEVAKVMRDLNQKIYPKEWVDDVLITGVITN